MSPSQKHIQVPKSQLEVNQISKLKIRNKEFLAVIRLASPSNKEEGGVQFLFPLFAVHVFEKRHQLSALLQSCTDGTRNNAMDHSARTLVANPTPQRCIQNPLRVTLHDLKAQACCLFNLVIHLLA